MLNLDSCSNYYRHPYDLNKYYSHSQDAIIDFAKCKMHCVASSSSSFSLFDFSSSTPIDSLVVLLIYCSAMGFVVLLVQQMNYMQNETLTCMRVDMINTQN